MEQRLAAEFKGTDLGRTSYREEIGRIPALIYRTYDIFIITATIVSSYILQCGDMVEPHYESDGGPRKGHFLRCNRATIHLVPYGTIPRLYICSARAPKVTRSYSELDATRNPSLKPTPKYLEGRYIGKATTKELRPRDSDIEYSNL